MTSQMLSRACCWNTLRPGPSAFANQTQGLCLAGRLPLHPGSLPPVHSARTASPPFLSSSMGLSSALGSGDSVLLVSSGFLGYLGRCRWNLSDQQDAQ